MVLKNGISNQISLHNRLVQHSFAHLFSFMPNSGPHLFPCNSFVSLVPFQIRFLARPVSHNPHSLEGFGLFDEAEQVLSQRVQIIRYDAAMHLDWALRIPTVLSIDLFAPTSMKTKLWRISNDQMTERRRRGDTIEQQTAERSGKHLEQSSIIPYFFIYLHTLFSHCKELLGSVLKFSLSSRVRHQPVILGWRVCIPKSQTTKARGWQTRA